MASTITDRASGLGVASDPNGEDATVSLKRPVRAATTANITLSGAQTIDGVSIVADDRVLVKDQTDATENGIYIAATADWTRPKDCADDGDLVTGTEVRVNEGSTNQGRFYCASADPIDIGTDTITWTQVTGLEVADGDKGDITVTSSGAVWTINAASVEFSMLVDASAASRVLGRGAAGGSGDFEELTLGTGLTMATTVMAVDKATAANIRASASDKVVTADGIESGAAAVALSNASATVAVNWDSAINFTLALNATTTTLGFPTNVQPGTWRRLEVTQDTTTRTLAFTATGYHSVGTTAPVISTGSGDVDVFYLYGRTTSIVEVYTGGQDWGQIA